MKISPFQSSQIFTQKFRFTPSCVADRNEEDICTFVASNLLILVEKNSMKFSVIEKQEIKNCSERLVRLLFNNFSVCFAFFELINARQIRLASILRNCKI